MKTRVLFWTDLFWPYVGGVEVLAAQYLRALSKQGYEFTIITRCEGDDLQELGEFEGMPVHRLNVRAALSSSNPRQLLGLRRAIANLVHEFQPDLLHIYHIGMGAMLFDGIRGIPRLMTLHGPIPPEFLVPNTALATLFDSVDYVACCSRNVLEAVEENLPSLRGRSSVILNALEVPDLPPTPLSFEPPRLLTLGRLVQEKGFDTAIDAFALLKPRFPALRMTIAGNGPAFDDLKSQVDVRGLGDCISLPGWVAPEAVAALINEHTLTVMPSRVRESFGLVALQSAQMARPVVASDIGGIPEVVEDSVTGLLVPQNDVQAFADAIELLLNEPEKTRGMGRKARERALAHFTWDNHIAAYDELMRRLTSSGA
ncbi:alpha-D-kanosaminyltransferase [Abditibacteriota bacterium]|nr:alpha-D-kanosaminyltransferase [Abditibacteriota bacterium]